MTTLPIRTTQKNIYPDSDGKPMADNTIQFRWIVLIKENLELIFDDAPDVFVAGDLLWYPVEGHPEICVAPDVMVAFGRAKGDRGSYQQWRENNIAPQVVFEILSPGNRLKEMTKKLQFYDRYGVEEYYIYDPETNELNGLYKHENRLNVIEDTHNWVSPRLQIRFALSEDSLAIYRPDGQKFLTTLELNQYANQESQRANQESQRADQESQRADQESQRADQEYERAERLLAQLMAMGIQPA
jgi:Uma2 family endonuclease